MSHVMIPAHLIFLPLTEITLNYVMSPEIHFLHKTVSCVMVVVFSSGMMRAVVPIFIEPRR